jgi:hypothetical protein
MKNKISFSLHSISVITLSMAFVSCASLRNAGCNTEQSYDIGANDASEGRRLVTARWDACDASTPEERAAIKAAYRKGYESARGAPTVNINLGSGVTTP